MREALPASPRTAVRVDLDGEDPRASSSARATRRGSRRDIVMASLGDLLLEVDPQNVPGTGPERDNWRRRFPWTLDDLRHRPEIASMLERIARRRREGDDREPDRGRARLTDEDLYLFGEGTHRGSPTARRPSPRRRDVVRGLGAERRPRRGDRRLQRLGP